MAASLLAFVAVLAATPPAPTRWVEDHAAFLSPQARDTLDGKLEAYQHETGHQIIVWIDKTLGSDDLADWSVRTFNAWKVGRKGMDDGVAMFIFADDRKIDIEVGYGLEDKVPDAIASRVIREVMAPKLQAGDRDGAVTAGVDAVLKSIEGKPFTPTAQPAQQPRGATTGEIVGAIVLALIGLILFIRYPRMALWFMWSMMSGGRFGGGGGGGGGGFSGGGGRSGGGGARGGW